MRQHGQMVTYRFGIDGGSDSRNGCRCDPCRQAVAEYEKERQRRTAPPYVNATAARDHITFLRSRGLGVKTIAARAGIAHGTISKLVYGNYKGRPPSRRIRRETADRILAVMPTDAADCARVPAERTWDNVDTLLERGWTKAAIGRAIGQTGGALQLGRELVHRRHADTIEALLDEPVPPRRSRHGEHPVPQPEEDDGPHLVSLPVAKTPHVSEQPWRARSACRLPDVPVWMFFAGQGDTETIDAAKAVCERCPVADECLDAHIGEKFGVWGNTTEAERRRLRRERGIPEDDEHDQEDDVA